MIESNGYVESLRPVSVFFPVPPTSGFAGTIDWYNLLSIHETRHMVQFSNIRDSFLQKILQFTFGGNAAAAHGLIPSYFFEGDAVLTETLLSDSGRGRSPSFERGLRTMLLSHKDYSFPKAFHRSSKDYMPNHYVLGYYLITYMRREYGANVVEKIISAAANNPLPMNFSAASLFITGKSMPAIYKDVMADLKVKWEEQDLTVLPTKLTSLNVDDSKTFTNHYYPKINKNGTLFYIEQGLDTTSSLVEKQENGEIVKHIPIFGGYSLFNNLVAYSEMSSDIRWENQGYSDIFIYDTKTKVKNKLTTNQRYFKPTFSTNGDRIATTKFSKSRVPSILILNSSSGEILQEISFNQVDSILDLSWNKNDDSIGVSLISEEGNQLGIINLETHVYTPITDWENIERSKVQFYNNQLLYSSSYSGIDGIYSIDLNTLEEYQVVSSRFGADYPSVFNNELIFSDYTISGFKINKIDLDRKKYMPTFQIVSRHVDYFSPLLSEEDTIPKDVEPIVYSSDKYNPSLHLINVHSWLINPTSPVIFGSEVYNSSIDSMFSVPEIVLFSYDYLELMDSTFYTHYNINRELWDFGFQGTYFGFYPELNWHLNIFSENLDTSIETVGISLGLSLPLSFDSGSTATDLTIGFIPYYYRDFRNENSKYSKFTYYVNYKLSKLGNQRRIKSYDFLFDSTLQFSHAYGYERPTVLGADITTIVSGLSKSSNLEVSIGAKYDFKDKKRLSLLNTPFPNSQQLWNGSEYTSLIGYGKAEYGLSLLYPDISIFNWSFLESFNAYIGYEGVFQKELSPVNIIYSKLELDYYLLRIPIPFESSFTYFYNWGTNEFDYNFNPISIQLEF